MGIMVTATINSFTFKDNYQEWINTKENENVLDNIRFSIKKGVPYGKEEWVKQMIVDYKLESTTRSPGRPKKYV